MLKNIIGAILILWPFVIVVGVTVYAMPTISRIIFGTGILAVISMLIGMYIIERE